MLGINIITSFSRLLLKTYSFALTICLFLITFSTGCTSDKEGDEYGTPRADYKVMGSVKSSKTLSPIKDIKVSAVDSAAWESIPYTITDSQGMYSISYVANPLDENIIYIKDIDGDINGLYTDKDMSIVIKSSELNGGDGWYPGKAEVEVNFILEEL